MNKALLLFVLLTAFPSLKEWRAAESVAKERSTSWTECFNSLDADPQMCEAIVFPEILRHNRLVDKVQTSVLLGSYLNEGKTRANYSIGIFQIKPSFAEEVEESWMNSKLSAEYGLYFDTSKRKEARHKRMRRLQSEEGQCTYVAMFYRLMLEREPDLLAMKPEVRLRYLATAYNYSFTASMTQLKERMSQKTFHLEMIDLPGTKHYSYCELALKRYKQIS